MNLLVWLTSERRTKRAGNVVILQIELIARFQVEAVGDDAARR